MDLMIKGKVAVVAGAGRGLGKAVAEALAGEGTHLAICSRSEEQIGKTAASIKKQYKIEVLSIACDVTSPAEIRRFKKQVMDRFGACHILFTNAGGPPSGKLEDFDAEDFKRAIDLNLMSAIQLVYAFIPFMKNQKWGRVIASASSNVRQVLPQFPLSNVSRIGIVAFIKTLAREVAPLNITANVLAPGLFMTEPTKRYLQNQAKIGRISYQDALEKMRLTIPRHAIGVPGDYGALAAFLASEHASYITGETILIDGGQYSSVI